MAAKRVVGGRRRREQRSEQGEGEGEGKGKGEGEGECECEGSSWGSRVRAKARWRSLRRRGRYGAGGAGGAGPTRREKGQDGRLCFGWWSVGGERSGSLVRILGMAWVGGRRAARRPSASEVRMSAKCKCKWSRVDKGQGHYQSSSRPQQSVSSTTPTPRPTTGRAALGIRSARCRTAPEASLSSGVKDEVFCTGWASATGYAGTTTATTATTTVAPGASSQAKSSVVKCGQAWSSQVRQAQAGRVEPSDGLSEPATYQSGTEPTAARLSPNAHTRWSTACQNPEPHPVATAHTRWLTLPTHAGSPCPHTLAHPAHTRWPMARHVSSSQACASQRDHSGFHLDSNAGFVSSRESQKSTNARHASPSRPSHHQARSHHEARSQTRRHPRPSSPSSPQPNTTPSSTIKPIKPAAKHDAPIKPAPTKPIKPIKPIKPTSSPQPNTTPSSTIKPIKPAAKHDAPIKPAPTKPIKPIKPAPTKPAPKHGSFLHQACSHHQAHAHWR
ncbi:hypothetical protein PMIN01_01448 [Paraphaeosphaeria minitans]|uniref:Uncharacterized protein n=1 Tax=Paraphaeosphaeria minitans TaxID=565426 RepID=A0A9P6KXE6_9PLEO|nr:hypothetical protein PMIN01_01448 [Paraphaeosphaeria minitans]